MTVSFPRRLARAGRLLLQDLGHSMRRRSAQLVPPPSAVQAIGGYDFAAVGRQLADIAIQLGELAPSGTIVDAGCGYGRVAVPLAPYLRDGRYFGFDVSPRAIRWCRRWITPRHPQCEFQRVDVRNDHYNPRGDLASQEFVFPYGDGIADVVFASSLFTHLDAQTSRRYIAEAARVLKPGGRLVASFFLLDPVSRKAVAERRGAPLFIPIDDDVALQDERDPEAAIAFSESLIRRYLAEAGLQVEAIHHGSWCERVGTLSYQDFIVARKIAVISRELAASDA